MKHAMDDVITRLIAEHEKLKEELRVGNRLLATATDKQRDLEVENDKFKDVLQRIEKLTKMYSADTIRHVLARIRKIVSEVLNNE